eukprot:CAMPEP_0172380298 /NCGR_PEP_ID=MMETSP1060-20121228/70370_1 /TAXON_ID=37318 /ORGANISM="Pseudo-nitzschia pungens, Strain cf. cingulata" /LENGTH=1027 /DNA_ID=CAMNT_0013108051 /DNA_START=42 /DNA_END=3125 /DNA_ORIENTATION=-
MSENPPESSSDGPPQIENSGNLLGGKNAGAKEMTLQDLRELRLARLGGGRPTSKARVQKPPPSRPTSISTAKKASPMDKGAQSKAATSAPSASTKNLIENKTSMIDSPTPAAPPSPRIQNDTPLEDTPVEDTPVENNPAVDTPVEDNPAVDNPAEDNPAVDNPVEDNPVEDNPAVDTPAVDTPVEDNPAVDNSSTPEDNNLTQETIHNETNDDNLFDLDDQGDLAAQEAHDLQAAIALSMGLPAPSANPYMDGLDLEPLPVSEFSSDTISPDLLSTVEIMMKTRRELDSTPTSTAPSTPIQLEDDDNDALMEDEDKKPAAVETNFIAAPAPAPISPSRILRSDPQHFSGRVRTWYKTAAPFNILDFHDCMWDKGVTTENDQKRWLAQGIKFKAEHDDPNTHSTRTAAGTLTATNDGTDTSSLLAAIISGPGVWCLTQQHGGPCGVLASIQAELLAILLFGPRSVHPLSMISIDFPTSLSTEFTRAAPDMSSSKMRQALALSMGMILARASLVPSATVEDDANAENESNEYNENSDNENSEYDNDPTYIPSPDPTVILVLPKNELWDTTSCLEWGHLEPWNSNVGGGGLSEHLFMYKISLNKNRFSGDGGDGTLDNTSVKRQKHDVDHSCRELAHATAQFLLETKSLNWFQRPGGVLLMVMSVAASRGIPKLQGDMDDLTAKLTTNFGHCSQELINLLLTGQAVSNVFDHTLRPSGELMCRGIQSQPAIGYLTQLEAMRYVEVGGFYKTPRFPVWVIGSTSHFTVMFGDGSALKESASDALLEKVRRAFKRMDGGAEENGFIQTGQLGEFLKNVGLKRITGDEVQMLAAFMDRYGAGIILWEDLWKRASRLLTGASIESILDGTDETNNENGRSNNIVSLPGSTNEARAGATSNNDTPMSDEELARKLQAEWNAFETDKSAGTSQATVDSDSTLVTSNSANPRTAPAEKYGHTFQLYHYNGLRGGNFKAFRVTRLSADEAIGASISLGSTSQATHTIGGFGGELDSVLRTKWPGCKINWISGSAPSID